MSSPGPADVALHYSMRLVRFEVLDSARSTSVLPYDDNSVRLAKAPARQWLTPRTIPLEPRRGWRGTHQRHRIGCLQGCMAPAFTLL